MNKLGNTLWIAGIPHSSGTAGETEDGLGCLRCLRTADTKRISDTGREKMILV